MWVRHDGTTLKCQVLNRSSPLICWWLISYQVLQWLLIISTVGFVIPTRSSRGWCICLHLTYWLYNYLYSSSTTKGSTQTCLSLMHMVANHKQLDIEFISSQACTFVMVTMCTKTLHKTDGLAKGRVCLRSAIAIRYTESLCSTTWMQLLTRMKFLHIKVAHSRLWTKFAKLSSTKLISLLICQTLVLFSTAHSLYFIIHISHALEDK